MKYGCCLNMIASKSDKTGIEHLRRLAMSGYDYVELPLAEKMMNWNDIISNAKYVIIFSQVQFASLAMT